MHCVFQESHCNGLRCFLLGQPQAFVFLSLSCSLSIFSCLPLNSNTHLKNIKNRHLLRVQPVPLGRPAGRSHGSRPRHFLTPFHSHPCPRSGSGPSGRGRGERRERQGLKRPREGGAKGSALTGALQAGCFPRAPLALGPGRWRPRALHPRWV